MYNDFDIIFSVSPCTPPALFSPEAAIFFFFFSFTLSVWIVFCAARCFRYFVFDPVHFRRVSCQIWDFRARRKRRSGSPNQLDSGIGADAEGGAAPTRTRIRWNVAV